MTIEHLYHVWAGVCYCVILRYYAYSFELNLMIYVCCTANTHIYIYSVFWLYLDICMCDHHMCGRFCQVSRRENGAQYKLGFMYAELAYGDRPCYNLIFLGCHMVHFIFFLLQEEWSMQCCLLDVMWRCYFAMHMLLR